MTSKFIQSKIISENLFVFERLHHSKFSIRYSLLKKNNEYQGMSKFLDSRDAELNMRMVVGDKDIPFASAYTIGYRIMQEFLINNPSMTLLEWTDLEAEDILSKSKYEEKFN